MQSPLEHLAAEHHFSLAAIQEALSALRRGGGSMAQFNHPELGGSGQWMSGSLMIGDMFNDALKARVAALFTDLVPLSSQLPTAESRDEASLSHQPEPKAWYLAALGSPSAAGGQNSVQYAFFEGPRRLAVNLGGRVTIYDTADHRIGGVAQAQAGHGGTLTFTSQHGTVRLADLRIIEA